MEVIRISEDELNSITNFLKQEKIIFHPKISPTGIFDLTKFKGNKFFLMIDRNLLVVILRLINSGTLKDKYRLKLVSSLLFWAEINNIPISGGLAMAEYSQFKKSNVEASIENNAFQKLFSQYNSQEWLDLASGRKTETLPVEFSSNKEYSFYIEDNHYKMHYLEMLKLSQLYFSENLSILEKFDLFHRWVFDNVLICKYTTIFSMLVLGGKSKVFKNQSKNFDEVNKKCQNQSWDLTYLSFWSTMYSEEEITNNFILFATLDSELKTIFTFTYQDFNQIQNEILGIELGGSVKKQRDQIYVRRVMPAIDTDVLNQKIELEKNNLKKVLEMTQ